MDLTFGLDFYWVQLSTWLTVCGLAAIVWWCQYWVRKGQAKRIVYGLITFLWIVSFMLLIASPFAIQQGMSTDALVAFMLPGLFGSLISLSFFLAFRRQYEQVENVRSISRNDDSCRS